MDNDTFCASSELVNDIGEEVYQYLFVSSKDVDYKDLIESCSSAIQEIKSWQDAIDKFAESEDQV